MRHFALAALLLTAVPVLAQSPVAPAAAPAAVTAEQIRKGQIVKDANLLRVGEVDRVVTTDGAISGVRVIYDTRFVTIPASTLSLKDRTLVTSLTRSEVGKIN